MTEVQLHKPFDSFEGKTGNKKNIGQLKKKLESLGITGILVGGCIDSSKPFPRKDIDVVVSSSVGREVMEGYDAWLYYGDRTENVTEAITYNSLGILALALGNLPTGLHVIKDYHPRIRETLPVTSYTSIADIVKPNGSDILLPHLGRTVAFSSQHKEYIGRLISFDMWFAQFDDLVELRIEDERNRDKKVITALKQDLREELRELEDAVSCYVREHLADFQQSSINSSNVRVNNVLLGVPYQLWRQYDRLREGTETEIPPEVLKKFGISEIERIILEKLGKPLTDEDVDGFINSALIQSLEYLGSFRYGVKPIFSIVRLEEAKKYKNLEHITLQLADTVKRKIEIERQTLDVEIKWYPKGGWGESHHFKLSEEVNRKLAEVQNKILDRCYMWMDSPDIFSQYMSLAHRNFLPYFPRYVGSYAIAKHTIVNLTNSPPLIMSCNE